MSFIDRPDLRVGLAVTLVGTGLMVARYTPDASANNPTSSHSISLSTQPPTLRSELQELYRANFSQWPLSVGRTDVNNRYYDPVTDEYHIVINGNGIETRSLPQMPFDRFDARLQARKVSGSNIPWYGFTVVENEGQIEEQRHRFVVSGRGSFSYEVATVNNEDKRQIGLDIIQPSTVLPEISQNTEPNDLRLIRVGNMVNFYINDELVYGNNTSMTDGAIRLGIVAITPKQNPEASNIDIAFSNFVVYEPEYDETLNLPAVIQ